MEQRSRGLDQSGPGTPPCQAGDRGTGCTGRRKSPPEAGEFASALGRGSTADIEVIAAIVPPFWVGNESAETEVRDAADQGSSTIACGAGGKPERDRGGGRAGALDGARLSGARRGGWAGWRCCGTVVGHGAGGGAIPATGFGRRTCGAGPGGDRPGVAAPQARDAQASLAGIQGRASGRLCVQPVQVAAERMAEGLGAGPVEAVERAALKSLPTEPYVLGQWAIAATVSLDYHVAVELNFYSVPHAFARKRVDVFITRTAVQVFHRGERVASHARLAGHNRWATLGEHM